ncbi:tetratricopeptide repeat protein [Sabulicella rubraurantiaca]|uniref:tetratricopeptide repeat protein n=1 Tax=Sabulicella rubraurantiaca TaxID=2811429 RepID=UPI001F1B4BBC|nr:tetratricopeptide repeat protein [Sabulicella rubraurantiaca]
MALPDLVDEVDEELRAERAQRLAQRFGGALTGLALIVLAGVGGWEGWKWWEARQASIAAGQFLQAAEAASAENADLAAVAQRFGAVAAEAPTGYRTLARLREAALLAESGNREGALAAWDALSRDTAVEELYRDLATVMWALHSVDSAEPGSVESRLLPLAADGAPWRASAREVLALLAIRRGNTEQARRSLEAILSDQAAPQGVRDRAGRLLGGLGS